VTPATDYFDKGAVVEEWADVRFFRPAGLVVARLAARIGLTADQLTVLSLLTGLLAGRLLFYPSVALNAAGVAMFLVSDVFDSSDGQLARMRGTSTRFGRILDGTADNLRFANLYIHLACRLIFAGHSAGLMIPLMFAAGIAHIYQSTSVDFMKQLYLHIAGNGHGEMDLPEDIDAMQPVSRMNKFEVWLYRPYVTRYARLFPQSLAVVRVLRRHPDNDAIGPAWREAERGPIRATVWIAQNIRFVLMAVTIVPGWPEAFLWITAVPMTIYLAGLISVHERRARTLLATLPPHLAEAA
jgi:phosphatidylglycerophosphate synthase